MMVWKATVAVAWLLASVNLACHDDAKGGLWGQQLPPNGDTSQPGSDAPAPDVAGDTPDDVAGDTPADVAAGECTGAARAVINGEGLEVAKVGLDLFMHANSKEGAIVNIEATAASGATVNIRVDIYVGLTSTITDTPLPQTIDYADPPPGFDTFIRVRWPSDCLQTGGCLVSDVLGLEYHLFEGFVTLTGTDYDHEMTMQLCLRATEDEHPDEDLQSAQIYLPEVTLPRWYEPFPSP